MSFSRILTIIGVTASILSALAGALEVVNPKWAAILAAAGGVLAGLNERLQGGLSTK